MRLSPVLPTESAPSASQQDAEVDARLAELQGLEFLWTAVTPSGSLILAPRYCSC